MATNIIEYQGTSSRGLCLYWEGCGPIYPPLRFCVTLNLMGGYTGLAESFNHIMAMVTDSQAGQFRLALMTKR